MPEAQKALGQAGRAGERLASSTPLMCTGPGDSVQDGSCLVSLRALSSNPELPRGPRRPRAEKNHSISRLSIA